MKRSWSDMIKELKIRFDIAPNRLTKQDFAHLIACLTMLPEEDKSSIIALLKGNSRVVNTTEKPIESVPEGYTFLDLLENKLYIYKGDTVESYTPAAGENFLILDTMDVYAVDSNLQLNFTGSANNLDWEKL